MQSANLPPDETDRVLTLHSLNVLNTMPEERFNALTRAARRMFSVSIAQVSLIDTDRQWIKSSAGWPPVEAPRKVSFCAHAILKDEVMHVEDALADDRFADNPLVVGEPHIRFYAGCPLRVGEHSLGTLCVIDRSPRPFSDQERFMLQDLARMVEEILLIEHQEATDPLTGLTNLGGFETLGRQLLAICREQGEAATLVYCELTGVEGVFQRMGLLEAERATKRFGVWLTEAFGDACTVARVGEDDFAVLAPRPLPGAVDAAIAMLEERMRELNRNSKEHDETQLSPVRRSATELGLNMVRMEIDPARQEPMRELLGKAQAALRGKGSG